jgi:hypothetical protein
VSKERLSGNGAALATSAFTFAGNFDISVAAERERLGFRGVMGVLVLFESGHFVNLYFRGDADMAAVNSFNGHSWLWLNDAPRGLLRIARTGTELLFQLDTGSGYRTIGVESVPVDLGRARAYLFLTSFLDERREFDGTLDSWTIAADEFFDKPCCSADYNGDGSLNVFDFLAYQSGFAAGESRADFAAPYGVLNIFDFLAYQSAFGSGC